MADKEETEKTIAEDLVVTKYKMAGDIVNRVLKQVIDKCVVGASVREICEFGDSLLTEETSKVFKKEKELKKGEEQSKVNPDFVKVWKMNAIEMKVAIY